MTAAFTLLHDLVPLWLGTVWLVSVAWVRHDAKRRIRNPRAALAAALAALLLPLAGAAAWALVRPPDTLVERRRRRLARLVVELDEGPRPTHRRAAAEAEAGHETARAAARRLAPAG